MTAATLDGAVALVTGANGGIGSAVCAALSDAGARVVGSDLGDASVGATVDTWLGHDVTSAGDWGRVVDEIGSRYGRLDCLINNAGIAYVETIAETSLDQWRRVQSVNVESILLGLQATLPLLRDSGGDRVGGSSVVNISSTAGLKGVAFGAAYCASKGAVKLLSKAAAKEFATLGYPIRVNSLHPSSSETPMIRSILERYEERGFAASAAEQRAVWELMTPLKRLGKPEEIAAGVVFLCTPAASFMTGTEFVIDGGATA